MHKYFIIFLVLLLLFSFALPFLFKETDNEVTTKEIFLEYPIANASILEVNDKVIIEPNKIASLFRKQSKPVIEEDAVIEENNENIINGRWMQMIGKIRLDNNVQCFYIKDTQIIRLYNVYSPKIPDSDNYLVKETESEYVMVIQGETYAISKY